MAAATGDQGQVTDGEGEATGDAHPAPGRRVELVEPTPPDDGHNARIGLGLLASLVIGFGPLRDAALGNGSFPMAVGRYLACLAASVVAALVLGRLLDGAPPEEMLDTGSENADGGAEGGLQNLSD